MIIVRYLVKETLKSQLGILFILLLVFFCQKMIRILSATVDGDIPANLVFSLLLFGLAGMAQLILPLSLFVAILITFGRLYMNSEMTAMFACGVSKRYLLKAIAYLSISVGVVATINNFWLMPKSIAFQEYLVANAKVNPSIAGLINGQFQQSKDLQTVLYIEDVEHNRLNNIFVAKLKPANEKLRPSIIMADSGKIKQSEKGDQVILLDNAISYEGSAQLKDFRITEFKDYQAIIEYQNITLNDMANDIERHSIGELFSMFDMHKARTEINWRLTLIFAVPLMAFIVLPICAANPRQGRMSSILPAIIIYLVYYLLISAVRSAGYRGTLESSVWMWVVNIAFVFVAVILNLWDTVPIRVMRERIRGKH